MLKIENLQVHYGGIQALRGISLEVPDGRIVTLIGANGAGKSTTLRTITGLVKASGGSVQWDGQELLGKSIDKIISTGIAMSPEGRRVFPDMTVLENLKIGAYLRRDKAEIEKDIQWVYSLFPRLEERSWQLAGTLSGMVLCGRGTFMAGCTLFRVSVRGTGCHGAMPETGVDPINIAAHIYLSLQELTAREISAKKPAVVTVGRFQGGQAPNIIPEEAVLEGTIRTFDRELSARIMERIRVIAENTAAAFRGSAHLEEIASAPPLVNDPALMEQVAGWAEELAGKEKVYRLDQGGMGSEDFASFTYELPCAYLLLGAGTPQEDPRYGKPMHNEAVVFNEDVLPTGAALHTLFALRMLAQET